MMSKRKTLNFYSALIIKSMNVRRLWIALDEIVHDDRVLDFAISVHIIQKCDQKRQLF